MQIGCFVILILTAAGNTVLLALKWRSLFDYLSFFYDYTEV